MIPSREQGAERAMVTATIVRRWRRPLAAAALHWIAAEERHCVIVITPTHVAAHFPAHCITAVALFGGAPPAAWVETTCGAERVPRPIERRRRAR